MMMTKENGRVQSAIVAAVLLAAILAAGRITWVCYSAGTLYTFGIFYLAVTGGMWCVIRKALFSQKAFFHVWVRILMAAVFTGFQVLGVYYSIPGLEESVRAGELLLWILCLSPLTYAAQNMLFAWVREHVGRSFAGGKTRYDAFSSGKGFCAAFIVIMAGFLIPFAAYYPAIMAYDVIPQLDQIKISGYTTHHPLIHTLMLAFSLKMGEVLPLTHNVDRAGLAVYTILQMMIVAGCFAYVYTFLRRKGVSKYACYFFVLCAAFYPTHGMLAVSITKDTIYGALVMVFTAFAWELATAYRRQIPQNIWIAMYLGVTVLLLLFRNNSVYAWFLYLIASGIFSCRESRRADKAHKAFYRKIGLIHAAALILYLLLNTGMAAATHATSNTYAREMLSVPAQQIARVVVYHEEELTEKDRELIAVVWGEEALPEYVPAIADRSKRDISGDSEVLRALREAWVSLGLRYPGEYAKAFLLKNKGMWYLEDSSYLNDIYSYAKGYLQITYPSDQQEYIQALVPGYQRHQKLQFLQAVYRYFAGGDAVWRYLPPLALVMQPAFYCWLLIYYGVCCIGLKKWEALIPAVYIAALAGTVLLGPCVLVRYLYPVMLAVVVLLLLSVADHCPDEARS